MPPADRIDLLLDRRLVLATLLATLPLAGCAALLGGLAAGRDGALGALYGAGVVGINGVLAALVSLRGGLSRRQIGIGLVVAALPVRLLLIVAAIAVAVGPLGLPKAPVAVSAMVSEGVVVLVQCWYVARGRTFVGPLDEGRSQ